MGSIIKPDKYPIRPEHIDTTRPPAVGGTFNSFETTIAAWWVICFCKERPDGSSLQPISFTELEKYYKNSEYAPPHIETLIERRLLVLQPDGLLHLTEELIEAYFRVAPAHQVA